jgi:formate-dependent phosphoribosylglycinamide formyltransferase (GAR transformylase)
MFGEAAERLGVKLIFATDCCDQLDDPWWDGAIPVRFHREQPSVDAILASKLSFDGILAVGDRPTVLAAAVAERLGLPGHSRDAAIAARDKRLTRLSLSRAGLPVPWFRFVPRTANPGALAEWLPWPLVVKPAALSGSRGVIRADNRAQFVTAFERLRRLLDAPDVAAARDPASEDIILESFIEGREYAVEGVLEHGQLRALAIFDKPDPLDGPFFEETIYVTPSRADAREQAEICASVAAAARALGLYHGPIHAECRVNPDGVFVLEVAARPIGGLCARTLSFRRADGRHAGLEELLLRHALGELVESWHREETASGVMMIPIPAAGVYRRVDGIDEAATVAHITNIRMTAKPDQQLVPLPEGSSYLGFIFARAGSADEVERALRQAHRRLSFVIDRPLPVL